MDNFLVGTGGWAYLKVPGKPSLKAYSEIFNFTEVNYTFYEYPQPRMVERWRRTVPKDFTFAVRCHQDLTHGVGLKPLDASYQVLGEMLQVCNFLEAPFLVLETPASYTMDGQELDEARSFLESVDVHGVRLVWEFRAPMKPEVADLMGQFNVVNAVDLSRGQEPAVASDVVYSRLFGKGQANLYQFTDQELVDIDSSAQRAVKSGVRTVALSYHGARMFKDALRFIGHKRSGQFLPATPYVGKESVRSVLTEDATFPASKGELIKQEGWKVVDLTAEKRVHLADVLLPLPDRQYSSLEDVMSTLKVTA